MNGVTLRRLEIETREEIDLRGFLGIDAGVKPEYEGVGFTVRVDADAPREKAEKRSNSS